MNLWPFTSSKKKSSNYRLEEKSLSLSAPSIFDLLSHAPTRSGVNITSDDALYIPAVLQAARLVAQQIGSLPCKLYRVGPNGKEEAKDHPAYKLVHRRTNEWTGATEFRTILTANALIFGDGFAKVVRFEDGRPFEMQHLKRGTVTVDYKENGEPVYHISETAGTTVEHFSNILHIRPFLNKSPITLGKEGIGLASILERHGAEFFKDGAKPPIVFTGNSPLGEVKTAAAQANVSNSFKHWLMQGGALFVPGDLKVDFPVMSSTDAQYLENRNFQIIEIARIFGVPPHLLFEMDRATWSNAETMGAEFLRFCLRPWLDCWSEALATVLLTEDEQETHYFEFVTDDLLRADAATRTANMTALVAGRIMTPNEARAKLNLPPLPGGNELVNPYTTSTIVPVQGDTQENTQ